MSFGNDKEPEVDPMLQQQLLEKQAELRERQQMLADMKHAQELAPLAEKLAQLESSNAQRDPFNQVQLPHQVESGSPVALNTHAQSPGSTTNVGSTHGPVNLGSPKGLA
ncbi:MAG: hypothetical protein IT384_19285 [Deltaproteobacteria bacterium]|nr:hypothetical protein [Deltaproteobacteria bacterium]